jgi:hypothetical protein
MNEIQNMEADDLTGAKLPEEHKVEFWKNKVRVSQEKLRNIVQEVMARERFVQEYLKLHSS